MLCYATCAAGILDAVRRSGFRTEAMARVIGGKMRPEVLKEVLAWASQNVALLATKWKELNP